MVVAIKKVVVFAVMVVVHLQKLWLIKDVFGRMGHQPINKSVGNQLKMSL